MEEIDIGKEIRNKIPFLNDRNLLDEIAEKGQIMNVEEGSVLMDYEQYIRQIPLVLDGIIKIMKKGEGGTDLFLYYLSGGSTCPTAFTCCMNDKKSEIRAIVEENARIILLPVKYIDEWIRTYSTWKNFIMHSYSVRFNELLSVIDDIAFSNIDIRLLKYLQKKSTLTGKKELQITHKEIAGDLNTSREAISRLLKKIEKMGLVKLGRNKIFITAILSDHY